MIRSVDIIIPHAWFPIVAAHEKADQDNIPLFGWMDEGWLVLSLPISYNRLSYPLPIKQEIFYCLPSFIGQLLVSLLHIGLCPVQLDRLRNCSLQSRQGQ